jgi:hypothetical protein
MMASAQSPDDLPMEAPVHPDDSPNPGNLRGLWIFFGVLGSLVALNLILSLIQVPLGLIVPMSILITVVVVAAPMLALYKAASVHWSRGLAGIVFVVGVATQIALAYGAHQLTGAPGIFRAVLLYISQAGLLSWCLGLGAFVATLIKDKNLLLPIAFFLAAFDVFLVLTPIGPTQAILKAHPEVFRSMAYAVPKIENHVNPTHGPVRPFAYIGPADLLFLGMFFVSLHQFGMRTRETFRWILPTLLGYLAIVLLFGEVHIGRFSLGALPALLPIGSVVLLVNRKEWKLNQEERLSTAVVALLSVGLVAYGMTRSPKASPPSDQTETSSDAPQNQAPGPKSNQPASNQPASATQAVSP